MTDEKFSQAMELGAERSDCHPNNLITLAETVKDLRYLRGDIAECGSYRCGASIVMAASAEAYQVPNNSKKVYAFDTFGGLPYGDGVGFENFANTDFEEIKQATAPYNIVLVRGKHEDTIPGYFRNDQFLSLIFMDSDHHSSHKVCLENLWPRLSHGGMVIFHDWVFQGVQDAIAATIPFSGVKRDGTFESSPNMGYIVKA